MTDPAVPDPSDEIRISDAERESAMSALGEHMSAGRIDVDEYGERSAKVTVAKTRAELRALFTDLPEPKPRIGDPIVPAASSTVPAEREEAKTPAARRQALERTFGALVPLSALVAVVLVVGLHLPWFVFFLPAAMGIIAGAVLGDDWKRHGRGHWHGHGRYRHRGRYDRGY